jgi:hypothetical protein
LDRCVQQHAIKTSIPELDAILVVLVHGVHGGALLVVRYQEHTAVNASGSRAISKPARTFQDLLVWQKAHQFVLGVYALTTAFPKQETYGLSLQMRRASTQEGVPTYPRSGTRGGPIVSQWRVDRPGDSEAQSGLEWVVQLFPGRQQQPDLPSDRLGRAE